MTRSRQTADWGSRAGLAKIVPSSVAVGSGTGSADTTGTVTFSGASSVSLNNVFSSTYDNYEIQFNLVMTVDAGINIRLRTSGTDASGSNYIRRSAGVSGTGNPTNVVGNYGTDTGASCTVDGGTTTKLVSKSILFDPNKAAVTMFMIRSNVNKNSAYWDSNVVHDLATSYDGFTLLVSSGTITGTVSISGYTN